MAMALYSPPNRTPSNHSPSPLLFSLIPSTLFKYNFLSPSITTHFLGWLHAILQSCMWDSDPSLTHLPQLFPSHFNLTYLRNHEIKMCTFLTLPKLWHILCSTMGQAHLTFFPFLSPLPAHCDMHLPKNSSQPSILGEPACHGSSHLLAFTFSYWPILFFLFHSPCTPIVPHSLPFSVSSYPCICMLGSIQP